MNKISPRLEQDLAIPHQRRDKTAPTGCERDSSISDTLQLIADPWRFLVIREAFFRARRFGEFASALDMSRATLTKCLAKLVEVQILEERLLGSRGSWREYVLTPRGLDLYEIFLGLMWYGDKWLWEGVPPLALFHQPTRTWFSPMIVWEHDLSPVGPRAVRFETRPNYWRPMEGFHERSLRMPKTAAALGKRPCTVERAISIVGDRWAFLIMQEFFHGNHRFEELSRNLGIASNVLTDRLSNLCEGGLISKSIDEGGYNLSRKGFDIYGPMILMKRWGDKWLRKDTEITSDFIVGDTGKVTRAIVIVPGQGVRVKAKDTRYITNYERPAPA
ncbi:helix-turn-helix transcriptional regulator [Agrobacterium tumefaciens]|nr:helix-turn-helix transcriptional regulator [Agrobacterium tumefaciens]NTD11412.1 helix-turn-helix transcriptional regulator [Agrobacterium tumefaciens]NTD86733.1 helix-turn-helix transcriptional regulator [Agrobacterium tumefaciens]NTD91460.1 helix-turn-helix transcriptional regulator [Agrobacterium tumefaciens]NTD96931.1 helix-turn-helix transcriptional regulator [Agrobacterium tumefaciens]